MLALPTGINSVLKQDTLGKLTDQCFCASIDRGRMMILFFCFNATYFDK